MADGLRLIGYGPSVYTRIVRMGLIELGLTAAYTEADPFAEVPDPVLETFAPLGRVPILQHGAFTLSETAAILRYLDEISQAPSMIPNDAKASAQMAQVVGIVDFYGYVPLVRDVFAHGYFLSHVGEVSDPARARSGLNAALPVLKALDDIAQQGRVLAGGSMTLADIHLAPMLAYFTKVPAGAQAIAQFDALSAWWALMHKRPSLIATDPLSQQ